MPRLAPAFAVLLIYTTLVACGPTANPMSTVVATAPASSTPQPSATPTATLTPTPAATITPAIPEGAIPASELPLPSGDQTIKFLDGTSVDEYGLTSLSPDNLQNADDTFKNLLGKEGYDNYGFRLFAAVILNPEPVLIGNVGGVNIMGIEAAVPINDQYSVRVFLAPTPNANQEVFVLRWNQKGHYDPDNSIGNWAMAGTHRELLRKGDQILMSIIVGSLPAADGAEIHIQSEKVCNQLNGYPDGTVCTDQVLKDLASGSKFPLVIPGFGNLSTTIH